MAAVIGRDFDLDVLARATQTTEDELLDTLEAAAAMALVREPADASGRYNFAHALIQHTLYEDLGPNRRARAHRQVAEALEEVCGDRPSARVGELARHWIAATQPIDLTKAIGYSKQAGDSALVALAPADALRHYTQALDLYPQVTDPDLTLGVDLAIGLGTAQRQTGDPGFRDTLLGAARQAADLGDTDRLVQAAMASSRGYFSTFGIVDVEKVEVLETALERLSPDKPERALVLATLCSELNFGSPLERRRTLTDEALNVARASGDDAIMVRVLNHVFLPLFVPQLLQQSLDRTAEALVRARRLDDPVQLFFAAGWRAFACASAGDVDEMDRCIEIAGSFAERLDQLDMYWGHTIVRVMRAVHCGDTDQAEKLATEALQIGADAGITDGAVFFGAQITFVSFQRGTMGELVALIEQMKAEAPDIRMLAGVLAMAHVESGQTDDARSLLDEFASVNFDLSLDQLWLPGMVYYAEAAIECRDPKYAAPLFDRLVPWADQLPCDGVAVGAPVSHHLGGLATVLGHYDEADAYFRRAAAMNDRMGAKFFAARTSLLWGRMLVERQAPGDIRKARELLTRAHTTAAANGYGVVERRAAAALERLSRPPTR